MTTSNDAFPPFATVYGDGTAASQTMTPRMACHLWAAAIFIADTWRMTRDDPDLLHDWLPPLARPHAHGPWLDQLIDCFERLAIRLAAGDVVEESLTTCTGEELALHLTIELAEVHLADGLSPVTGDIAKKLPPRGPDDEDFDEMRERLFRDHDVLLLFDPMLDGIDDPDSDLARLRRTVNLHPSDWFKQF